MRGSEQRMRSGLLKKSLFPTVHNTLSLRRESTVVGLRARFSLERRHIACLINHVIVVPFLFSVRRGRRRAEI